MSMEVAILSCYAHNQFHLGKTSLEDSFDIIHSDTLFSAIVSLYSQVYPKDVEKLVEAFKNQEIMISSAFHCLEYQVDQYLFFLPKPVTYHYVEGENIKKIKKIRFFSLDVWRNPPEKEFLLEKPHAVLGDSYLLTDDELTMIGLNPENRDLMPHEFLDDQHLVRQVIYPKVRVHETEQTGGFFNQVNIQLQQLQSRKKSGKSSFALQKQTHFYFLLDTTLPEPMQKRLKSVIRLLADEGIGGERSTGCGTFQSVVFKPAHDMGFPERNTQGSQCALSLTIPQSEIEFGAIQSYQLVLRGGGSLGISGDKENHRRQVRMVVEGSVFSQEIKGAIANVSPPGHPGILRNGLAFSLPFQEPLNAQ